MNGFKRDLSLEIKSLNPVLRGKEIRSVQMSNPLYADLHSLALRAPPGDLPQSISLIHVEDPLIGKNFSLIQGKLLSVHIHVYGLGIGHIEHGLLLLHKTIEALCLLHGNCLIDSAQIHAPHG